MTKQDLRNLEKYSDAYTNYCRDRECGEECPVFVEHLKNNKISCFSIFCQLSESGKLPTSK